MVPALEALDERGAHFVRCRADKRPLTKAWQKNPASLEAAQRHKGLVGVVPASLGCVVVDVDEGGEAAADNVVKLLGQPLARVPTRREGGEHLWYQCPDAEEVGNRVWAHGDIRGAKGYSILWHPERVAEALADTARPLADLNLADLDRLPPKANGGAEGERNITLNGGVYGAKRNGAPIEPHVAAAREAGLPEREIEATVKSAVEAAERDGARKFIPNGYTPAGLAGALNEVGVGLRLNVRRKCYEYEIDGRWEVADDERTAALRRAVIPRYCSAKKGRTVSPLTYSADLFLDLRAALGNGLRVDPFIEWLEGLPAWDGQPRIDGLLSTMFGAAEDDLTRWSSRYIGLGAIQRAYEPGCKLDEVPVLLGEQGVGKSAFTQAWFPLEHAGWHGDAVDLSARFKEQAEAMAGRVVVEISELAGMRKSEIEQVKSFISRQDDGQVRFAYARAAVPTPRRCIFVGTTNEDEALPNDPSGNRRFVVVELEHGCDVEEAAREREPWWGEALARYRQGERANLPRPLHLAARQRAEAHRGRDSLEEEIVNALHDLSQPFSVNDLYFALGGYGGKPPNRAEQMRLTNALKQLGFTSSQATVGGARVRRWSR